MRRSFFAVCCALCLGLLLGAYANSLHNEFHFDDGHVLVGNIYVRSLGNVPKFFADARTFSAQPRNATYRPIVSLSLALDYAIAGGLSPLTYHVSQLAQLVLLGAVLVVFYRKVMDRALPGRWNPYLALFGSTLFCVHTVNTETMNLMHARSEIQSALGLVLGFIVYWTLPRTRRFLLYLLPVALGALAKLPAILFGPLLFVWLLLEPERDGAPTGRLTIERIRRAAVASAPSLVAGVLLFGFIEYAMRAPDINYGGTDRFHYAITQAWAWVHYLRLFLLPLGLTADTDLTPFASWHDTRVFAGAALVAGLVAIGWKYRTVRNGWPVTFGLAWFALGLMPTSSILPLAEPVNEHRVFLAYIGLVLAVVWAARLALPDVLARWNASPALKTAAPAVACSLLLVGHAVGARARNEVWRTEETLWADVTSKSPQNGRGWMNYGLTLMARGDYPGAKACFERALPLTPNYSVLEINLGILHGAMGDPKTAETHFERALELEPRQPGSHFFYARWLVKEGRSPEALPHLEEALRLTPASDDVRGLLMDLRAARGDSAIAGELAREYLAISPGNARARAYAAGESPIQVEPRDYDNYFREGVALGKKEQVLDSALAYRAALELDPDSADALNNLGFALGRLGFFEQALPHLEAAVKARPDFQLAHNNLAWVKERLR